MFNRAIAVLAVVISTAASVSSGTAFAQSESGSNATNERTSCPGMPPSVQEAMRRQQNAWNDGDVESFMSMAYWESDSLLFIGSKGVTVGYDQTLRNYTASYPDSGAMGTLTFINRSWKPLGGRHALLIGAWHLERKGEHEPLSGHYSLVWRKEGRGRQAKWVIIADHSS